ncbi:MAG: hypothetical protein J6Y16_06505 [Treponema sp.]|nr:hypothetical protein [Treponema sp.]
MCRKFTLVAAIVFLFAGLQSVDAQIVFGKSQWNDQKLFYSNSDGWVYDTIADLCAECGQITQLNSAPLPKAQLMQAIEMIDRDSLKPSSQVRYDNLISYLGSEYWSFGADPVMLGIKARGSVEVFKESEDEMERKWDYLDRYLNQSGLFKAPVYLTVGDYVTLESGFDKFGNYSNVMDKDDWTNLQWAPGIWDWPKTAYASIGIPVMGKYAVNLQIGRNGMQIGNTSLPSVILSNRFVTDGYVSLSFYSPAVYYTGSVQQIETNKYFYLHHVNIRPFKFLSLGLVDGTLVSSNFELRFLNPLMFMHSFYARSDGSYENHNGTSQYLGLTFECVPFKNLRIYGLFAQNEIQAFGELSTDEGRSIPNGMAWQFGATYSLPTDGPGSWVFNAEGQYVSPWCYTRWTPESTFISNHINHFGGDDKTFVASLGGPDSAAATVNAGYEVPGKWSAKFSYDFVAHGENYIERLLELKDPDPNNGIDGYYYYPSSGYYRDQGNPDSPYEDIHDAVRVARDMSLSGIVESSHKFTLSGEYIFNKWLTVQGEASYKFMLNAGNVEDKFLHGIEGRACLTLNLL